MVQKLLDQARAQGYRRTEIRDLEVRPLAETLAMLLGNFVRFDTANQPIATFGFAYIVLKSELGWKIVSAIAYPVAQAR